MRNRILYYAVKYKGDFKAITNAILHEEAYEKISYDGKFITLFDKEYPDCLLRLKYKPWILFYEGDISLLQLDMIAVVGARMTSSYGKQCVRVLENNLAQKYGIISGLAKGIDAQAHACSLRHCRKTIAVIGCGIDICYPKENEELYQKIKKEGLIVSEYPYGCKPLAHHFPWRNRIIAALSQALVVVEAKKRSGTMITVNEALDIGIPIYSFPHRFDDENGVGCNQLIAQGAMILTDIEDIKEI